MLRQHDKPEHGQNQTRAHELVCRDFFQQCRKKEQRVDAQHHEAALGKHDGYFLRGYTRMLLTLQQNAQFETGQHKHDGGVEPVQRGHAAFVVGLRRAVAC